MGIVEHGVGPTPLPLGVQGKNAKIGISIKTLGPR